MSAAPQKSLTVVHGSMAIGGIEQLLIRVTEVLRTRGWRVQFVLQSRVDTVLDHRAAQVGPIHQLPNDYRDAWPRLRHLAAEPSDVIFAPTSDAYVLAHLLRQARLPGARIVAGVYYPFEYANRAAHRVYEIGLAARLLAGAADENVIFMNEPCRRTHAEALRRPFSFSPVVPIPLVVPRSDRAPGRPAGRRLVSIGRLVPFKGYTFGALAAVETLRAEGRDFVYDIYGGGPVEAELRQAIADHSLGDVVRLRGEVGPERFGYACADAFAFLGMGTAAVEAAALGVPTLLAAVEERGPRVHGWFSQVEGYRVGEVEPGDVLTPMADVLRELDDAGEAQYQHLADQGRRRAHSFELGAVVDALEQTLLAARPDIRRLSRADLLLGWGDRLRDSRHVRRGRPSRRALRYERAEGTRL